MNVHKNKINLSVAYWPLADYMSVEELLGELKKRGVTNVELVDPEHWPVVKEYGFNCTMCKYKNISYQKGWNDLANHEELIEQYSELIRQMAHVGFTNIVCFSGTRGTISDELGLQNCVIGLNKLLPLAVKHSVVLQMELLSQQIRPGYMCDSVNWGVQLCRAIDSPNFLLLYDIFHMQLMEGDVIQTIRNYHPYFGHYHVAGVPDRHNIDERQELCYPGIMKEILKTGYKGHVALEYLPEGENKMAGIIEGLKICGVTI